MNTANSTLLGWTTATVRSGDKLDLRLDNDERDATERFDPYSNFNFTVEADGNETAIMGGSTPTKIEFPYQVELDVGTDTGSTFVLVLDEGDPADPYDDLIHILQYGEEDDAAVEGVLVELTSASEAEDATTREASGEENYFFTITLTTADIA